MAEFDMPCEKICIVDHASGLYRGCGRGLDEIDLWASFFDGERTSIVSKMPHRLAAMDAGAAASTKT
jgi:uncharacterized protein